MVKSDIQKGGSDTFQMAMWALVMTTFLATGCTIDMATPGESLPTLIDTPTLTEPTLSPSPEIFPTMHGMPGGGPCTHLLWPLWSGGQWTYQWEGVDWLPLTLYADVQDTTATAALTWDDASGTLHCTSEGLVGMPSLLVIHPDLGTDLSAETVHGAFLPTPGTLLPLAVESMWDAEYTLSGTLNLPLPSGTAVATVENGRLVLMSRTLPIESILLPFGQLNALPVEQLTFIDTQVTLPDGTAHGITIDMQIRLYYAEEIGLMRVVYEGGMIAGLPQGGLSLPNGIALNRATP